MQGLYILSVVFHMAAGCALSGENNWIEITGHEGGSVLLPCSCTDLHSKPQEFTWKSYRTGRLTEVLNEELYRGRLQLFNDISASNLSLIISDLREEDQGDYTCSAEKEHREFWLHVKGFTLVKHAAVEKVTGFTGESVVLPCVCTDLQDKPKTVTWEFNYKEIYPQQTGHHRNRTKLVSKHPQGNVSLLISHLTEDDQGIYTCSVLGDKKKFRLYVQTKEQTTIQPKTTPPSEQPQSKVTNSLPKSASSTQSRNKQEPATAPLTASSSSTQSIKKQEAATTPPTPSSSSTQGQINQETPTSAPTQDKKIKEATTNPPPASSSTLLVQDYSSLLILLVLLPLTLGVVASICWRCRGARSGAYIITKGRLDLYKVQQENPLVSNDSLFTTVNYTCDTAGPQ